jgi:hypothetical protein
MGDRTTTTTVTSDDEIRARVALHETPLDAFRIELATAAASIMDALTLLQAVYADKRLATNKRQTMRIMPHHLLPVSMVFVARHGDRAVGTISITQDSPVGLPLDKDYATELGLLRDAGCRLGEIHSLAVEPQFHATGLMSLLAMVSLWSLRNVLGASHGVIGVHPRAEGYYRAIYAFARFGAPKTHAELEAPVVGLCVDVGALRTHLRTHFTAPLTDGRRTHEHVCDRLAPCFRLPLELHGGRLRPPTRSPQTIDRILGLATSTAWRSPSATAGAHA